MQQSAESETGNRPLFSTGDAVLNNSYRIIGFVKKGAFSEFYGCEDLKDPRKRTYTLKIQRNSQKVPGYRSVRTEVDVMKKMKDSTNISLLRAFGKIPGSQGDYLVFSEVGLSLADAILKTPNGYISFENALRAGVQITEGLRDFHDKGLVHRNISPSSCVFGRGRNCRKLYISGLGAATEFTNKGEREPPNLPKIDLVFASPNLHRGLGARPRDDFWSLFYTMLKVIRGNVPWEVSDVESEVKKMKEDGTTMDKILAHFPGDIKLFVLHVQATRQKMPRHHYLKKLTSCSESLQGKFVQQTL